jgi:hypothetical protein
MECMPTEPLSKPGPQSVIREYIAIDPEYCNGQPHLIGHRVKFSTSLFGMSAWE